MNVALASTDAARARVDVLVFAIFDSDLLEKKGSPASLQRADEALGGLLLRLAAEEGFKAKADQTFVLHTHGKLPAPKVLLLGLGAREKFTLEALRLAIGRATKMVQRLKAKSLAVQLPVVRALAEAIKAAAEGVVLGAYRFERWRTANHEEQTPALTRATLVLPEDTKTSKAIEHALELGLMVGEATNWARDLVNEPAGTMTPSALALEAKKMAKAAGLSITVGDRKKIAALEMGLFLGVAKGSVEEPQLVQVSYIPKGAAKAKARPLCLVGKAITFDSGGLSLKPSESMIDMKTDMAGSAAVLAAMKIIARLAPPFPVHAFMGMCENMPSGHAYRLGDVLVSRLGKTVEVTNTDAEGRLVLGDVLAWANELEPAAIIDLATLTGACVVALGNFIVGAFGDDDALMFDVLESARSAGEELWRLPLSELQKDSLKSEVADMKNTGERAGGAITASVFLKEFVGSTPWVHLDIAGPSMSPKERGYFSKGATGVGVRTLVEFVRRRAALVEAKTR